MTTRDPLHERRVVEVLSEADAANGERSGSRRLWAYGYAHIAELAGCDVKTARDAAARGLYKPGDMRDVVRWADERLETTRPARVAAECARLRGDILEPTCGGDLLVREVGGMALYTEKASGERVYMHRCSRCHGHTERPSVGGTCQLPALPAPPVGCGASECDDGEGGAT